MLSGVGKGCLLTLVGRKSRFLIACVRKSKSSDLLYTELMDTLRKAMDALARKIEPKIYAYGFLRE